MRNVKNLNEDIKAKDKMIKVVLLMVLCSGIAGNQCKVIPTPQVLFDDYSSCIVYGYDYSHTLMTTFDPEWTNSMEAYTKFSCESAKSI
mgnify:FL=1